jgi:hypothetical protein
MHRSSFASAVMAPTMTISDLLMRERPAGADLD